jgi:hypothetical protein
MGFMNVFMNEIRFFKIIALGVIFADSQRHQHLVLLQIFG